MEIRTLRLDDAATIASFVARLQLDPAHMIAYFGANPAEIAGQLRAFDPDPDRATLLAYDKEHLLGLLGVDLSDDIHKAWLYGPLVDTTDWDTVADALYQHALATSLIPPGYTQETFVDIRHQQMAAFAARHGFPARPLESFMSLSRANAARLEPASQSFSLFESADAAAFIALHDDLFPETYYKGQAIIDRLDERNRLYLSRDAAGQVNGYIYAKAEPDSTTGYIDYLGVAESARRRGLASGLTRSAISWLLTFPQVEGVELTVMGENAPAIALYQRLGFTLTRTLIPYRKPSDR